MILKYVERSYERLRRGKLNRCALVFFLCMCMRMLCFHYCVAARGTSSTTGIVESTVDEIHVRELVT